MDYKYLIEVEGNRDVTVLDILSNHNNGMYILNILCYHINTDIKYPFIQFMLEKLPYCEDLIKEQFVLPSTMFTSVDATIKDIVIEQVKKLLFISGCNSTKVVDSMYKGIFFSSSEVPYALVNITGIDINYMSLKRDSNVWFGLPTEITNNQSICNIPIHEEIQQLFLLNPMLSIINENNTSMYPIPDVVYSGGEYKEVEFNSIFGERKRTLYENLGENHYFFRDFGNAVKEGGWCKKGGTDIIDLDDRCITHNKAGRLVIDNEYGRYRRGGINRYALFMLNPNIIWKLENSEYLELEKEGREARKARETRETREEREGDNCAIISFAKITPDILVKEYSMFHPLSYHELDKRTLGQVFSDNMKNQYSII
jgi:hypothetical protein